jgi:hypothetical protein
LKEMLKLKRQNRKNSELSLWNDRHLETLPCQSSIATWDETKSRQQSANHKRQRNCWYCRLRRWSNFTSNLKAVMETKNTELANSNANDG